MVDNSEGGATIRVREPERRARDSELEVKNLVRPERFELPTCCSGGNRSIQLSYGRRPLLRTVYATFSTFKLGSNGPPEYDDLSRIVSQRHGTDEEPAMLPIRAT
jgi:hypothetical protein